MSTVFPAPSSTYRRVHIPLAIGLPIMLAGWVLLWTLRTYWNPLLFFGLWTGAILVMYSVGKGYPGPKRHAALSLMSIPVWWWFEMVNGRVGNWTYSGDIRYGVLEYALLASLAFSTVVPALDAAHGVAARFVRARDTQLFLSKWAFVVELVLGVITQVGASTMPQQLFPLVWVAPALILDGLAGLMGKRNFLSDIARGDWRLAVQVGLGGLLCGVLWEFWNYWAVPRWEYHISYLSTPQIFAMPLAGYLGYIPFAWSIYVLTTLLSPGKRSSEQEVARTEGTLADLANTSE